MEWDSGGLDFTHSSCIAWALLCKLGVTDPVRHHQSKWQLVSVQVSQRPKLTSWRDRRFFLNLSFWTLSNHHLTKTRCFTAIISIYYTRPTWPLKVLLAMMAFIPNFIRTWEQRDKHGCQICSLPYIQWGDPKKLAWGNSYCPPQTWKTTKCRPVSHNLQVEEWMERILLDHFNPIFKAILRRNSLVLDWDEAAATKVLPLLVTLRLAI